jgi:elongation factor P
MGLIGANELKRKMLITVDGQPYTVIEIFFASPSARGASTMVRTKLRHLITDAVLEKSFKTSEKFEEPDVVLTPASFLYSDGEGFHFMDEQSYEQFVELAVASTELGTRGDTGSGGATKPATLETGLQIRVPLFIKEGEVVRVSTQTGEFVSRA